MSLTTVLSISVRPDKISTYEEGVRKLVEKATQQKDAFHWGAYQTIGGDLGWIHFVSECEDWAALGRRDVMPPALALRLFNEKEGRQLVDQLTSCVRAMRQTVSRDRPDLSYAPDRAQPPEPFAVVTLVRAHPGKRDECEEMIRKLAEAIPKVGDPSRMRCYQTLVGDLRTYWTVRPFRQLADLDTWMPPEQILTKAFGSSEGGLVFRAGTEAMERTERSITMLRPELSFMG
jgi:hypothetical protein